jgi:hypothetical protein
MRIITTALAAALALAGALVATPAHAQPVAANCGAVLTSDAYLADDLYCSGNAVTLTGDLVFDLRGHKLTAYQGTAVTVTGDGSPTIRNGRIADSGTGLAAPPEDEAQERALPPRSIRIANITFARNRVALDINGTRPLFVAARLSTISVWKSRFRGNSGAITGNSSGPLTVRRSIFTDNGGGISLDGGSMRADRLTMLRNEEALNCVETNPCALTRSSLRKNGTGIRVQLSQLSLWRTRISGSDTAVSAVNLGYVRATRSTFDRNRVAVDLGFSPAVLKNNSFYRNTTGFTADFLGVEGVEARLIRNRFSKNRDGIFTESVAVFLQQNRSFRNRRWGIYAPKATDLGGNQAFGNGQSPQCVGVAC